jgi:signal transduction histidine kinase
MSISDAYHLRPKPRFPWNILTWQALAHFLFGHHGKLQAELAEQAARLAQENEELARRERAQRRTAEFMVHDLKTALSCIGGFSDELLDKPALREDPETALALACIRRQARRMMGSVSDFLQLGRLREQGALPRESVPVTKLLQEAARDCSLPARPGCVALGQEHLHCPAVSANPQLLRRVLCNLISNAVKHNGPDTRVWLDARLHPSGREVVFSCRDDGAGVPPEVLPSVFDEFFTTDDPVSGSTGLGLAFCKGAVDAHGGRIGCENLTHGALFFFTIPLGKEHARQPRTCNPKPRAGRQKRAGVLRPAVVHPALEMAPPPDCRWALFTG